MLVCCTACVRVLTLTLALALCVWYGLVCSDEYVFVYLGVYFTAFTYHSFRPMRMTLAAVKNNNNTDDDDNNSR